MGEFERRIKEIEDRYVKEETGMFFGGEQQVKPSYMITCFMQVVAEAKKEFPKPRLYTDFTAFTKENEEHLNKGEPLEDQDYPRGWSIPNYKKTKTWFVKWFGDIKETKH